MFPQMAGDITDHSAILTQCTAYCLAAQCKMLESQAIFPATCLMTKNKATAYFIVKVIMPVSTVENVGF